jgi:polysaccharide export outer membrane protein
MDGGKVRRLARGLGAALMVASLGSGCQSLGIPAASNSLSKPSAKDELLAGVQSPPAILLGPPLAAHQARAAPVAESTWRPVEHQQARVAAKSDAKSGWHRSVNGDDKSKSATALVGSRRGKQANKNIIPASMKGGPTLIDPKDAGGLPPPRELAVELDAPIVGGVMDGAGCAENVGPPVPRELAKVSLPPYVIEPPDVLLVQTRLAPLPEQKIDGQHLVRPDGSISLGIYGNAYVAGLTLDAARDAIAAAINASRLFTDKNADRKPIEAKDISVDVLSYNSKVYYVITDGGGYGEQVYKFPVTGNETVLDAISNINGLPSVASKKQIWVARRSPGHGSRQNVLPVDWVGLTQGGGAATNYQVFPGDRVYVQSDKLIRIDSGLAKFLSPIERILGTTLLGSTTYNSIAGRGLGF